MSDNRRIDARRQTVGLMSSISDETDAFLGVVEDISSSGVRMSKIPARFDDSEPRYEAVIIYGADVDFMMNLQPRWIHLTNNGMYKMIGFKISNPPPEWTKFIMKMADKNDPLQVWRAEDSLEM